MKPKTLSTEHWAKFFELMEAIVNTEKPANDKAIEVKDKAIEMGYEAILIEFIEWYDGTLFEKVEV